MDKSLILRAGSNEAGRECNIASVACNASKKANQGQTIVADWEVQVFVQQNIKNERKN